MVNFFENNKAMIHCPVFDAKTKVSACETLRYRVWRGENPEVRKGCQACMRTGKCPVAKIIDRMNYEKGYRAEEYVAAEPVEVKLEKWVLERIRPTIVPDNAVQQHGASAPETKLILTANERIDKMMGSAPTVAKKATRVVSSSKAVSRKTTKAATNTLDPVKTDASADARAAAARSGDLGAAINEENGK